MCALVIQHSATIKSTSRRGNYLDLPCGPLCLPHPAHTQLVLLPFPVPRHQRLLHFCFFLGGHGDNKCALGLGVRSYFSIVASCCRMVDYGARVGTGVKSTVVTLHWILRPSTVTLRLPNFYPVFSFWGLTRICRFARSSKPSSPAGSTTKYFQPNYWNSIDKATPL